MDDLPSTDPLLPAVEEALILTGMSQTRFGYQVAGDPALVGKLRKGLILKTRRRSTIERALKDLRIPRVVKK